jgi:hypothetical protein
VQHVVAVDGRDRGQIVVGAGAYERHKVVFRGFGGRRKRKIRAKTCGAL